MGKLAGVISYDDNVKNQFKYINNIGYVNRAGTQTIDSDVDYSNMFPPVTIVPATRVTPPLPGLIKIKKSMNKIGALFKAGNAPEFMSSFRESIADLVDLFKKKHFWQTKRQTITR
jgi:hypothetical protein